MEQPVTLQVLLWCIGAGLGLLSTAVTLQYRIRKDLSDRIVQAFEAIGDVKAMLSDFRVTVAKDYVTNVYLKQEVDRINVKLDHIETKLDRLIPLCAPTRPSK